MPGVTFVMVRMEVDYLKELRWPGDVEIGTAVAEFGRTSFKAAQGIFHDGMCAGATGRAPRWSAWTLEDAQGHASCRRRRSSGSDHMETAGRLRRGS